MHTIFTNEHFKTEINFNGIFLDNWIQIKEAKYVIEIF